MVPRGPERESEFPPPTGARRPPAVADATLPPVGVAVVAAPALDAAHQPDETVERTRRAVERWAAGLAIV